MAIDDLGEPLVDATGPILTHECPRCGTRKVVFDVIAAMRVQVEDEWKMWHEAFAVCKACYKSTVFRVANKEGDARHIWEGWLMSFDGRNLEDLCEIDGYIKQSDMGLEETPKGVPAEVEALFQEALRCRSVSAWNACGGMLRATLEKTVADMEARKEEGKRGRGGGTLHARLEALFERGELRKQIQPLVDNIRLDGNDAMHTGGLGRGDAEATLDFTRILLEEVYTLPANLAAAVERRETRRNKG